MRESNEKARELTDDLRRLVREAYAEGVRDGIEAEKANQIMAAEIEAFDAQFGEVATDGGEAR